MTDACSKIIGERIFFNISLPSTRTFGAKKHWLLVVEDSMDFAWSYFFKEKKDLTTVVMGLLEVWKLSIIMAENSPLS